MKSWTVEQDAILSSLYPTGGSHAVQKELNKPLNAIYKRAKRLGVTVEKECIGKIISATHSHVDMHGSNNPNWKNGISKNNMHYKELQIERYPERAKARIQVVRAIRKGILKRQPCEICGKPKAQAHHDDYSKPLNVRWLCKKHHDEVHISRNAI